MIQKGTRRNEREEMRATMVRKMVSETKAKGNARGPALERGGLSSSPGAWKMSDEEEARIFSSLKENWKKTTLSIRDRVRILDQ
jgi:hypothetical protein